MYAAEFRYAGDACTRLDQVSHALRQFKVNGCFLDRWPGSSGLAFGKDILQGCGMFLIGC